MNQIITNKTVFFQGDTQYKNTGDVLINKSLLDLLRKQANVIVNDGKMPSSYVAQLELNEQEKITSRKTSFLSLLLKTAFLSRKSKVYLIAGPPGHLFGNSFKRVLRNLVSALFLCVLRLSGVVVIKIGFSIGPFGRGLACSEMIRAKFTDYYLVRDSISLKLAHRMGIKKAKLFPDLAWPYLAKRLPLSTGNKVLITFRDAVYTGLGSEVYHNRIKECLRQMLGALSHDTSIEIVYQVTMDYEFCRKLYQELKDDFRLSFNEQQVSLESAASVYGKGICIITNRLHAALLAFKYGALPVILTDTDKHAKITGIYTDAGIQDLLLDAHESPQNNAEKFAHLLQSRQKIYARIESAEKKYIETSNKMLEKVFS